MYSPTRLLRWLLVPLRAFCSLHAMADTPAGAAQALHLLGYLVADYPATVVSGEVLDAVEYGEQLELIAVLQEARVLGTLPLAFFEFAWLGIHATLTACRPKCWRCPLLCCSMIAVGLVGGGVECWCRLTRRPAALRQFA